MRAEANQNQKIDQTDLAALIVNVVQPLYSTLQGFDPSEYSLSGWVELFEEYCAANAISDELPAVTNVVARNQRRTTSLSCIGPRAYVILQTTCLIGQILNRFQPFWKSSKQNTSLKVC